MQTPVAVGSCREISPCHCKHTNSNQLTSRQSLSYSRALCSFGFVCKYIQRNHYLYVRVWLINSCGQAQQADAVTKTINVPPHLAQDHHDRSPGSSKREPQEGAQHSVGHRNTALVIYFHGT